MPNELETYLDQKLAPGADQLNRRARRVATLAGRLVKATASGDMKLVETALRDLQALPMAEPLDSVVEAADSFDYRKYLGDGFGADFEAACREAGLPLEGYFPNYFAFPFPVRVDVDNPSVIVNRRRVGMLRPSVLVATIQEERERLERSPFNVTEFLGALFTVWDNLNAQQSAKNNLRVRQPQPLKQVYRELVPFARWRRDYPESLFAFDVQRLLLSNELLFNGWKCDLERGRKGANALRLIDHEGQERLIASVNFIEAGE
ncbi:MAG: hypothetical protein K0Q72_355 [Armatimonadetes bacterium]|jgi:hypothetical protein|nr:hypothetical protein [Armatimonadota bacterium]